MLSTDWGWEEGSETGGGETTAAEAAVAVLGRLGTAGSALRGSGAQLREGVHGLQLLLDQLDKRLDQAFPTQHSTADS